MRPELFHIGPLPIFSYGFMILLAFLMGMKIGANRFRAKGMNPEWIYDIGLLAMISGVLGARIFYLVQYREHFDWLLFSFADGVSWAGAVLGILLLLACYRQAQAVTYLGFGVLVLIMVKYLNFIAAPPGSFHIFDLAFLLLTFYFAGRNVHPLLAHLRQLSALKKIGFTTAALLCGAVGMRVVHCYQFAANYSWDIFMIWRGGLVFYGGFLFGTACLMYFFKKNHLPILKVSDVLAPTVALGLALTRIGCFLNGCCFGATCPVDVPYGVHFPAHSLAGQSQNLRGLNVEYLWKAYAPKNLHYMAKMPGGHYEITHSLHKYLPPELYRAIFKPVYPSQLFASLSGFALFVFLLWFYRYRRHDGDVLLMFGILYGVFRFIEEMMRNDTSPVLGMLTVSQVVSLALFCPCAGIFLFLRLRDWWQKHCRANN